MKDESLETKTRKKFKQIENGPTGWSNINLSSSDLDSSKSGRSSKGKVRPVPEIKYLIRKREYELEDKRPFKPFASFNKPVTFFELNRNSLS